MPRFSYNMRARKYKPCFEMLNPDAQDTVPRRDIWRQPPQLGRAYGDEPLDLDNGDGENGGGVYGGSTGDGGTGYTPPPFYLGPPVQAQPPPPLYSYLPANPALDPEFPLPIPTPYTPGPTGSYIPEDYAGRPPVHNQRYLGPPVREPSPGVIVPTVPPPNGNTGVVRPPAVIAPTTTNPPTAASGDGGFFDDIPTWAIVAGAAAVVGGIALIASK